MNSFTLNDSINSRIDLGLRITEPPIIPVSRRVVEAVPVDGREGTLTILRGWEDVTFEMRVALIGDNPRNRHREILPMITSAESIYFSNDSEVYYRVKHVESGGLERRLSTLHEFPLTFTCEPFRYMRNAANITLTSHGSIANQGGVFSLPRITVHGTGNQTLTIGGGLIRLNILAGHLVLDSRLMTCHRGNVAQNNQMQGAFPRFETGSTHISWSSGITRLVIEPRWRFL